MRRMYQTHWLDIQFSDFIRMSPKNLAGPEFYQAYYKEFFKRYKNWEELPSKWQKEKKRCAEFIMARSTETSKILSVGCGLGSMEHYMNANASQMDIFIQEVALSAWHWIGNDFSDEHKLLGMIPDCLPKGTQFDLVYLSAVDYALDNDEMVRLLTSLHPFLNDVEGKCVLISASFQNIPTNLANKTISYAKWLKFISTSVLDICGLRNRGQFWGWCRTQKEYQSLMKKAGYSDIQDGFIDPERRFYYWIAGH